VNALRKKVHKQLHVLRMFTDMKEFNYDPPEMYFDKESGDLKYKKKET
jgi:hypothetical protein